MNKKDFKLSKRYKNIKLSYPFIGVVCVFVCMFLISIGWSAFVQKLFVDDISIDVRPKKDIRITNVEPYGRENSGISTSDDYDYNRLLASVDLPNAGSSVTYKVELTNFENTEMGILAINGLPENLEMEISDYNLKDKICVDNRCNLGIQKNIYIKIKYKENGFKQDNTLYNLNLIFDFRSFHKITYTDFNEATSDYPQEVMDGDNLKIQFGNHIDKSNLQLFIGNENVDFDFTDNTLEFKNVTADVEIKYGSDSKSELYLLLANESKGTDKDFNFQDPVYESGVFMHEETKDDPFPVYYYRGAVNNNVIYANYCWKIVRTTETGGIKLVYNGEVESGTCVSDHDYLGSETFNPKLEISGQNYPSPSQVGYKYEETRPIQMIAPSYLNDSDPRVLDVGTVFGHDVTYDKNLGKYVLQNTITISNLNKLEDDIRGGSYNAGFHYTCLTHDSSCQKVYYVYFDDYGDSGDTRATGLFGISLDDGLDVKETLEKMLYNSSNALDSHAKTYLDQFFRGEGSDFTRSKGEPLKDHLDELDDVLWCNDRTIAGYHGWDLSADNHSSDNKYLHFAAFKRLIGETGQPPTRPDITCDIPNDAFTVNNSKGNKSLTYPIAMLTADEAVLAGAVKDASTDTYLKMKAYKNQFFMTPYYISDDHVRMFTINTDGELDSGYASQSYAIRPAIALNASNKISSGKGTTDDPYIIK